ncbi:(2Fe-2S)-binding protein [Gandjariella thermophila]|uniref:Ferric siderophore reductase C-terminal domain-containing protein n=1 Tax=Gandjariella thermophila TaxID=1931992 RepID=A0A4D4J705_9PSEU|nr:(2Fe-2S)-binding protein [Gandjariella thermophila]GDY30790.1 hypothetical protein GTS_24230 [Gandjariella thermophila]
MRPRTTPPHPDGASHTATGEASPQVSAGTAGIEETIRRIGGRHAYLPVSYGSPITEAARWRHCAALLDTESELRHWRSRLAEWLRASYGDAPERTVSGYLMSWYLLVPGYLGALLFHAARRVPSLRPEDVAFRLTDDRPHPDGIALLAPGFACLPDDPASGTAEATTVADEHALAALLRARFAGHAARFVAAFAPTTRFGRRTLWAAATDALDIGVWLAGRVCGDEGAGVADAALLLPERLAPFTSGSTLRRLPDAAGEPQWTRRRESCCFHFALPGAPAPCATCPRVTPRNSR